MKKTFKGLIADQTQIQLRLSTNNGLTGYKIVKLVLFPQFIGSSTAGSEYESLLKNNRSTYNLFIYNFSIINFLIFS